MVVCVAVNLQVRNLAVVAVDEARHGVEVPLHALGSARWHAQSGRKDSEKNAYLPTERPPPLLRHSFPNLRLRFFEVARLLLCLDPSTPLPQKLAGLDPEAQRSTPMLVCEQVVGEWLVRRGHPDHCRGEPAASFPDR